MRRAVSRCYRFPCALLSKQVDEGEKQVDKGDRLAVIIRRNSNKFVLTMREIETQKQKYLYLTQVCNNTAVNLLHSI